MSRILLRSACEAGIRIDSVEWEGKCQLCDPGFELRKGGSWRSRAKLIYGIEHKEYRLQINDKTCLVDVHLAISVDICLLYKEVYFRVR